MLAHFSRDQLSWPCTRCPKYEKIAFFLLALCNVWVCMGRGTGGGSSMCCLEDHLLTLPVYLSICHFVKPPPDFITMWVRSARPDLSISSVGACLSVRVRVCLSVCQGTIHQMELALYDVCSDFHQEEYNKVPRRCTPPGLGFRV
jgi:hypothetical protein